MARSVGAIGAVMLATAVSCGGRPGGTPEFVAPTLGTGAPAVPDDQTVAGVIEAPDGTPAENAVVAVNDLEGEPLAIVRTDASGRFESRRPTKPFAITVTSGQGTAAFVPSEDAAMRKPLRIRLAPTAEAFTITAGHRGRCRGWTRTGLGRGGVRTCRSADVCARPTNGERRDSA